MQTFGIVLTTGYVTYEYAPGAVDETEQVNEVMEIAKSGASIEAKFGLPGVPSHPKAYLTINPNHVVCVVDTTKLNENRRGRR